MALSALRAFGQLQRQMMRELEHMERSVLGSAGLLPRQVARNGLPGTGQRDEHSGGDDSSALSAFTSPQLPVDMVEKEDGVEVHADLPGVKKEDIRVDVDNGTLRISAERKAEREEQRDGWTMVERSMGRLQRAVALPDSADDSSVKASFEDGVLKIKFGKRAEHPARGRRVDIE